MNLDDINLRVLETSDLSEEYLGWFTDKEVTEFSENQYKIFTRKS
tara:strand:+ start:1884 stop:2018 length:135 start_codon:yes stop_codon:yes gene_type:complete